jgi:hypothetical protein
MARSGRDCSANAKGRGWDYVDIGQAQVSQGERSRFVEKDRIRLGETF